VALAACGLVKAEYLLAPGDIRPFVGLGAGVYNGARRRWMAARFLIARTSGSSRSQHPSCL
jgi:hypothetical protein